MMILTKEVIIINKDGNKVNTVIRIRTCRVKLYSVPPAGFSLIFKSGTPA